MTGHYYLNGNWRIDFPQQIEMAGKNSNEPVLWIRIRIRMFLASRIPIRIRQSQVRIRLRILPSSSRSRYRIWLLKRIAIQCLEIFILLILYHSPDVCAKGITAQQMDVDLRFCPCPCSNIEQVGLTWALFAVTIMCISGDGQRLEWGGSFLLTNSIQSSVDTREMVNLSRGPTLGDFVTILTEGSMQDVTVARLQSTRVPTDSLSPVY